MRRTVITLTSLFILWTSAVYAVNPTDVKNLPPHKLAKLGPVGHDIVPGYVEQEPINDVIHSAMIREQQPQENTSKAHRLTGPSADTENDFTKENLKALLRRYETKNPPLNQDELMRVENFIIQSQEQKKSTISVNRSTASYRRSSRATTDLIISEYCDFATSGYTGARFIEIYNPTSSDIDLGTTGVDTNLYIAKYSNGSTSSYTTILSGTIAAGDVFVVANNQAKFTEKFGIEADLYSSNISGNGDDVFAISTTGYPADPTPNIFDIIGEIGVDGTGEAWEHLDQTIVRNPGYGPNTTWTAPEWSFGAGDETFATPGVHVYTALSEGFEGTFPPTGWTNTTITGHAWEQSSSYTNSGSYSAKYKGSGYSGYQGELITPRLNLTASSIDSLVYYLKNDEWAGDQNECAVYVSTDLGTTWTLIASHNTDVSSFTRFAHNLESYTQNDSVYIKFLGEDNYGWGVYLDDLTGPPIWVDTNPVATLSESSLDFGNVNTASSSSQTVVLTNSGGGALTGTITSDATEFTVGTATIDVAVGASDTITITYTPSAEGTQSGNIIFTHNAVSSPDTVTVSGTGMAELLVEGFEGSWPPSGWTDATTASYGWYRGPYGSAHSGSYWAYCNLAGSELVTPLLTVPSTGEYRIRFWYRNESSNYAQSMDVKVGSDILLQIVNNATNVYQEEVISLAAYAGQNIQVTFVGQTGTGGFAYGFCLDDVMVELIPPEPTLSLSYSTVSLSPSTFPPAITVSPVAIVVRATL